MICNWSITKAGRRRLPRNCLKLWAAQQPFERGKRMKQMQAEGNIVQCIGAVIDVEFEGAPLPKIYDALILEGSDLVLEVQQQLGDGVVRAICLGSAEGLRRGLTVKNMGAPIQVPVGAPTLGRIMDVLGR